MRTSLFVVLVLTGCLVGGSVFADDITIWDERSTGTTWYGPQEDQEVEPGMVTGQQWDLEGFFFGANTLTMVAGFNFVSGVPGYSFRSGDIFIDTDNDAQFGAGSRKPTNYNPYAIVADTFGYDFVIDLNFSTLSYSVFDISGAGTLLQLTTVEEQSNDGSNPWRYRSGGTELVGAGGTISYTGGLSNAQAQALGYDVTGGTHNAASVDLSWLSSILPGGTFISHFTMECGNDNLMGSGTFPSGGGNVPEPATLVLVGLSVAGMIARKKCRA